MSLPSLASAVIARKRNAPVADKIAMVIRLRKLGEALMMARSSTLVVEITETLAGIPAPAAPIESEQNTVLGAVPVSTPQDVADFFDQYHPAALAACHPRGLSYDRPRSPCGGRGPVVPKGTT